MNKLSGNIIDIFIVNIFLIYSLILGINTRKTIGGVVAIFGIILWLIARYQLGQAFSVKPQATFIVRRGDL